MIGDILRTEGDALERFTRDLTADAHAGRLEPVRCRDDEIARVIDILLRHGKNNPTLVGPAGVGKTAIAEGLAQRIAAGNVPLVLRDVRLLSLDHVALLAGTTYRGQYEERIRAIVAETTAARDVILFIDELHNLIGQGTALGTAMDAANMLKPALVRGDFRVIGATTADEYTRWILGDPALERRFQKIVVTELGEADALEILRARKERLERHHNVVIADEALVAAIQLTDRWVTDRMRPDKAIDALDEACAHLQATTTYSASAERLIRERITRLREQRERFEREEKEARRDRPYGVRNARRAAAAEASDAANDEPIPPPPDPLMSALERFGAELEAMFVGAPPGERRAAEGSRAESADDAPVRAAAPARSGFAQLEAELTRTLMDDGVVVRGHDVARVVGLMSGHAVEWSAAS